MNNWLTKEASPLGGFKRTQESKIQNQDPNLLKLELFLSMPSTPCIELSRFISGFALGRLGELKRSRVNRDAVRNPKGRYHGRRLKLFLAQKQNNLGGGLTIVGEIVIQVWGCLETGSCLLPMQCLIGYERISPTVLTVTYYEGRKSVTASLALCL